METQNNTNQPATIKDLQKLEENLSAQLDSFALAIKQDMDKFATKDDLKAFATKEDIYELREDLKDFATREDLRELKYELLDTMTGIKDEILTSNDNIAKKLVKDEAEQAAHIHAHFRQQEKIDNLNGRLKHAELKVGI